MGLGNWKNSGPPLAIYSRKGTWNFSKFHSESPYIRREFEIFPSPTRYIGGGGERSSKFSQVGSYKKYEGKMKKDVEIMRKYEGIMKKCGP